MVNIAADVFPVVVVAVEVPASAPFYAEGVLQVLWWQLEEFGVGNWVAAIYADDGTLLDEGVVAEVGGAGTYEGSLACILFSALPHHDVAGTPEAGPVGDLVVLPAVLQFNRSAGRTKGGSEVGWGGLR